MLGIISHMKSMWRFHFMLPMAPKPVALPREPRLAGWTLRLRSPGARPARGDASDFQDTQPSIRDTGFMPR